LLWISCEYWSVRSAHIAWSFEGYLGFFSTSRHSLMTPVTPVEITFGLGTYFCCCFHILPWVGFHGLEVAAVCIFLGRTIQTALDDWEPGSWYLDEVDD
jgi:hypothetical protein